MKEQGCSIRVDINKVSASYDSPGRSGSHPPGSVVPAKDGRGIRLEIEDGVPLPDSHGLESVEPALCCDLHRQYLNVVVAVKHFDGAHMRSDGGPILQVPECRADALRFGNDLYVEFKRF